MKTILALTDFSAHSLHAVGYAADLAVDIHAQLVIFNAIQFPVTYADFPLSETTIEDTLDSVNTELTGLVEKIKMRTKGKISVTAETAIGSDVSQVQIISARLRPLAIAMGVKPGKSPEHALFGNFIFQTIHRVPFPVLIIPHDTIYKPIREIGLACDLEDIERYLPFETLKEWLSLFKPNIRIIHVSTKTDAFKPGQLSESITLQNQLQSFHPSFHFIDGQKLDEELNEFSKTNKLDLLIVVPKKHSLSNLLHRSHSGTVISHSLIPVLEIHKN